MYDSISMRICMYIYMSMFLFCVYVCKRLYVYMDLFVGGPLEHNVCQDSLSGK